MIPAYLPMVFDAAFTQPFALILHAPVLFPAGWLVYIGLGIAAGFGIGLIALGIRHAIDERRPPARIEETADL